MGIQCRLVVENGADPLWELACLRWHRYGVPGGGRRFNTLLTARADQLYLNFLRGGEGLEHLAQVQVAQGRRRGAGELVMGVDFTVVVIMLVGGGAFAVGGVVIIVMLGFWFVTEQRAVEFLAADHATCGLGQVEQCRWIFQLLAHGGDLGFVGGAGRYMFEAHQVHGRAVQFQLQGLAVQYGIQAPDAMFMGAEAAVLVVVVFVSMSDSQWQQGKRQSKQQTAHERAPG